MGNKESLARVMGAAMAVFSLHLEQPKTQVTAVSHEPEPPARVRHIETRGEQLALIDDRGGTIRALPVLDKKMLVEDWWERVRAVLEGSPGAFTRQDLVDLEIYFPIYYEAGKKYEMPWFLLWIIHQEESTVSRNPLAFTGESGFSNGMQRHPDFWDEGYVDEAVSGAPSYLSNVPVRHPTDVREIFFAARRIREAGDESGASGEEIFRQALLAYCAPDPAARRFQDLLYYRQFFGD